MVLGEELLGVLTVTVVSLAQVEPFSPRSALTVTMTVEHAIRALAGTLVLAGLILSQLASPWWLLLTALVGLNLLQSAFTKFCPAEMIMRRLAWFGSCAPGRLPQHPEGW